MIAACTETSSADVACRTRRAGDPETPGYGDTLFQTSRELAWLGVVVLQPHPHVGEETLGSFVAVLARAAVEQPDRPADDPMHAVAPVESAVRVLEYHLHGAHFLLIALCQLGGEHVVAERDDGTVIGGVDAQEHLGESGLTRSRLPDEPDGLTDADLQVDTATHRRDDHPG
jgi:hypothetical protein